MNRKLPCFYFWVLIINWPMRSNTTAFLIFLVSVSNVVAQQTRVIEATHTKVDIRLDEEFNQGNWNITPAARPDVYDVYTPGRAVRTTFITDRDSLTFNVKPGDYYEFVVLLNGKDSAFTAIKGNLEVPRAKFSEAYQKEHRGKTFVEIPKVYELLNFTELNHAFIGPESVKYSARINRAFADLSVWNDPDKPARHYDSPMSSFDEYMNWALVSARYVDVVPAAEQAKMIADIGEMMKHQRGFRKFPEFNSFLVSRYRNRKSGQTIADLYPSIIEWFEQNK